MLDNYQFTLVIVAVGLGAYLGSYNGWHMDHIDALTAQLAALEHEPLGDTKEGETGIRVALAEFSSGLGNNTLIQRKARHQRDFCG